MTTRSLAYTQPPPAPPQLPGDGDVLGRAGRENFKVASRVLPRAARDHLMAFYGYARLVDYIGDEYPGDRLAALAWIEEETERSLADPHRQGLHNLVAAAAGAVNSLGADPAPLFRLIEANRQDQTVSSYGTFEELAAYCSLSANPVGRLVLAAFGAATPARVRFSDSVCTALQLVEHWQDVKEDARAGRVYIPAEDLDRFGVSAAELVAAPPASRALRSLMVFESARARRLLREGTPVIEGLDRRARWAVAGFIAGGHAALDAIAACGFDPLYGAPRPRPRRVASRLRGVLGGVS